MNFIQFINIYLCIDKKTNVVVWTKPNWSGYPNLKSPDINVEFINFKNTKSMAVRAEEFENFEVQYNVNYIDDIRKRPILTKHNLTLTDDDKQRLRLMRVKCAGIYLWLDSLMDYMKKFDPLLPEVHLYNDINEKLLIEEESKKVKELINEIINQYYNKLWMAEDEQTFIQTMLNVRKNSSFH